MTIQYKLEEIISPILEFPLTKWSCYNKANDWPHLFSEFLCIEVYPSGFQR